MGSNARHFWHAQAARDARKPPLSCSLDDGVRQALQQLPSPSLMPLKPTCSCMSSASCWPASHRATTDTPALLVHTACARSATPDVTRQCRRMALCAGARQGMRKICIETNPLGARWAATMHPQHPCILTDHTSSAHTLTVPQTPSFYATSLSSPSTPTRKHTHPLPKCQRQPRPAPQPLANITSGTATAN